MLDLLKKDLAFLQTGDKSSTDTMMESVSNQSIRDAFLDNLELRFLGAEDDPEIEKQIEQIPEYDELEMDASDKKELEMMSESFVPDIDDLLQE